MKILNFILLKVIHFINQSPTSFVIYFFAFIVYCVPIIILFFIDKDYWVIFVDKGFIPFALAMIIASLMDIKSIIVQIWQKTIGKILYGAVAYFVYTYSEILAKKIIYSITLADPEQFLSAIKIISAIFFIPSFLVICSYLIIILYFLAVIISLIYNKLQHKIDKLTKILNINLTIHKYIVWHIIFFSIANVCLLYYLDSSSSNLIKFMNHNTSIRNICKEIIYKTSYFPNNKNKVCSKIVNGAYIKFLGDNRVSIVDSNSSLVIIDNESLFFTTLPCN